MFDNYLLNSFKFVFCYPYPLNCILIILSTTHFQYLILFQSSHHERIQLFLLFHSTWHSLCPILFTLFRPPELIANPLMLRQYTLCKPQIVPRLLMPDLNQTVVFQLRECEERLQQLRLAAVVQVAAPTHEQTVPREHTLHGVLVLDQLADVSGRVEGGGQAGDGEAVHGQCLAVADLPLDPGAPVVPASDHCDAGHQ